MTEETDNVTLDVLNEFLSLYSNDADTGKRLPVEHYQVLFPGYEEVIAAEYSELESEPDESPAEPGSAPVIERLGPYRLLREIGHGGQGVVYLAEHEELGRRVALKLLSSRLPFSKEVLARFRHEAELASRLQHPGICTLFDAGEVDGVAFIAMQYIEGESLAAKIARARTEGRAQVELEPVAADESSGTGRTPGSSRGPCARIVRLVEQAARSIHAVHQVGIVHRDLKPGNILVNAEGQPVVLDFGLAREDEREGQGLTRSGDVLGTPAYLPPERLRREVRNADARTDVYGLGVTLYECLTLRRPFESATREGLYRRILGEEATRPSKLNRRIPRDLEVVLQTALEKDPERRYQSAQELAEDLRRVRSFEPIRARAAGPLFRAWRWSWRNPVVAMLLLLLSAALLAIGVALVDSQSARREAEASLEHSHALGLVSASREMMEFDEAIALQLARKAYEKNSILPEALTQLHAALINFHEQKVWRCNSVVLPSIAPHRKYILVGAKDNSIDLLDRNGILVSNLPESCGLTGFFPDGRRFFTNGPEEESVIIRIVDDNGGVRPLGEFSHDPTMDIDKKSIAPRIQHIAISPSGHMICTSGQQDRLSYLWVINGKEIVKKFELEVGRSPCGLAVFSPDGRRLVTVPGKSPAWSDDCDPSPRIWDTETGQLIEVLEGHERQVLSAVYSRSGDQILTASKDGSARIWDMHEEEAIERYIKLDHGKWWVMSAEFSPDGKRILTAARNGVAHLWTIDGQKVRTLVGHTEAILAANYSTDEKGQWILTRSEDRTIGLWSSEGENVAFLRGHQAFIRSATFIPGRSHGECIVLSSAFEDETNRIWSLDDEVLPVFRGHLGKVTGVGFLKGGIDSKGIVVTSSEDGTIRLWNEDAVQIDCLQNKRSVDIAEISRDGQWLLSSIGRLVVLWEWNGEKLSIKSECNPFDLSEIMGMALSPAGYQAILGPCWSGYRTMAWDSRQLTPLRSIKQIHKSSGCFSPDGDKFLLLGRMPVNQEYVASLRNSANLNVIEDLCVTYQQEWGMPSCSQFSPDGGEFTLGTFSGMLATFMCNNECAKIRCFRGHDGCVTSISYSNDGRLILTTSEDGTSTLWDRKGNRIITYKGHRGAVNDGCFNPDGSRVLTASSDGTVKTWFTDPIELYDRVNERLEGYVMRDEIRRRYADLLPAGR